MKTLNFPRARESYFARTFQQARIDPTMLASEPAAVHRNLLPLGISDNRMLFTPNPGLEHFLFQVVPDPSAWQKIRLTQ
jgi:hypothetical protein